MAARAMIPISRPSMEKTSSFLATPALDIQAN
jgi:hypothetical protein